MALVIDGSGDITGLTTGALEATAIGSGAIRQVVQTTKTDTFTTVSLSKVDITGMSVSITPTSSSSKILVVASINYGGSDYNFYCDLLRGSTVLNAPASGYNPCTVALCAVTTVAWEIHTGGISYLDSPATTSPITYKLQVACQSGGTFCLNRSYRNGSNDSVCSSTITVMEIAA